MARRLAGGDMAGALAAILRRLPLAGSLARVCPAPCERACRRAGLDSAVKICGLKASAADAGLSGESPYTPEREPSIGKSVAVVGAGPAGLAAAYFLCLAGCGCVVIDDRPVPGGMLRHAIPKERLPDEVFDADVALLRRLGVEFHLNERVGPEKSVEELGKEYDAVVLAVGSPERLEELIGTAAASSAAIGALAAAGALVDPRTGATSIPAVFAGGNALRSAPSRMSVRAVADGQMLARSVLLYLEGKLLSRMPRRFDSRRPALTKEELALIAAEAAERFSESAMNRGMLGDGPSAGSEIIAEAARCLDCGCSRGRTCKLRALADELETDSRRFAGDAAALFERIRGEGGISFEPGKCIRCGICVRVAEQGGDRPGLAFSGRGAGIRVRVPFGGDIGTALRGTAAECVVRCPTGALAWDHREKARAR
jgi:ferredoxin